MGYSNGLDVRCERKKSLRVWQDGVSYLRWEATSRAVRAEVGGLVSDMLNLRGLFDIQGEIGTWPSGFELTMIQPLVMPGSGSSPDISLLNLYPLLNLSLLVWELIYKPHKF